MRAQSISGKSPREIGSALQQSITDGFYPSLAIVFIAIKQDRKAICNVLQKDGILGATCCTRFIDAHQSEREIDIFDPIPQQENDGLANVWKSPMEGFYMVNLDEPSMANTSFIPLFAVA